MSNYGETSKFIPFLDEMPEKPFYPESNGPSRRKFLAGLAGVTIVGAAAGVGMSIKNKTDGSVRIASQPIEPLDLGDVYAQPDLSSGATTSTTAPASTTTSSSTTSTTVGSTTSTTGSVATTAREVSSDSEESTSTTSGLRRQRRTPTNDLSLIHI